MACADSAGDTEVTSRDTWAETQASQLLSCGNMDTLGIFRYDNLGLSPTPAQRINVKYCSVFSPHNTILIPNVRPLTQFNFDTNIDPTD